MTLYRIRWTAGYESNGYTWEDVKLIVRAQPGAIACVGFMERTEFYRLSKVRRPIIMAGNQLHHYFPNSQAYRTIGVRR